MRESADHHVSVTEFLSHSLPKEAHISGWHHDLYRATLWRASAVTLSTTINCLEAVDSLAIYESVQSDATFKAKNRPGGILIQRQQAVVRIMW